MEETERLLTIYHVLLENFDNRRWWPADSPFEVIIGAILTQSVSWKNVKKALENLKTAGYLDAERLYECEVGTIASLIKPSRFYNQKARKIKRFLDFFYTRYHGSLEEMSDEDTMHLRSQMLTINGLGNETVDSILLYACNKPVFVVDGYTKRILTRYGLVEEKATYDDMQLFFTENLPPDRALFNDYHAQLVHLGNSVCKIQPECELCPLKRINRTIRCQYYAKKDHQDNNG